MTKIEIRRMVTAAAAVCEEKKAERISILELDPADSGLTDYFLICSGSNSRQNQAIANGIEDAMKREFGTYVNSIEGYRQGDWILLDYVDYVVHIFSEEKRDFYDIERLRKTATSRSLDEMKASLTERVTAARKKQAAKKIVASKPKKAVAKKAVAKKPAKKSSKKNTANLAKGKAVKPVSRKIGVVKKAAKKQTHKKRKI